MGPRCVTPSDTVARLAGRISERFAGERVQRCTTRHPGIADLDLTGQRLRGTDAVGRHLLLRFDDVAVHGHVRLDGRWLAGPRATEPLWRRRLELRLDTGWLTALDMTVLDAVAPGDESEVIRHVGPDLCGRHPPDLDEVVERMASRPGQPLAGALLDRRNAVGFDDVYAVEVPFICGVSPFQPVGTIVGLHEVVAVGAALLRTNSAQGSGNTTGRLDRSHHWVHGRAGSPCPVCRTDVAVADERTAPWQHMTFWCPSCQPTVQRRAVDASRVRRLMVLHPALGLLHRPELATSVTRRRGDNDEVVRHDHELIAAAVSTT
jgi:endonuclease VIII